MQGHPGRPCDDDAAAAFGLTVNQAYGEPASNAGAVAAEGTDETFGLWPENVQAVAIFQRMQGQWRMGFGGPVALDYTALPVVAAAMGLRRRVLRAAFEPLRLMEAAALGWLAEQRGNDG